MPFLNFMLFVGGCLWGSFRLTVQSFFFTFQQFCRDRKKWRSNGAKWGEYDGCRKISHLNSLNVCNICFTTCGLALLWRKIAPYQFVKTGRFFSCIVALWLVSVPQYFLADIASPSRRSAIDYSSEILPNGEQRRDWKQARFSLGFCPSTSFFSASFASNVIITDSFFNACNNSAQERFLFLV